MEQMTGYALSGICNAESPEMTHARVQEACIMAEKMLQNSIEMVEYKGKTMGEWVKSVKKLQQLEDHLREVTKMVEQLEAERDAAVEALKNGDVCESCKHFGTLMDEEPCAWCSRLHSNFEWRGVQKEE